MRRGTSAHSDNTAYVDCFGRPTNRKLPDWSDARPRPAQWLGQHQVRMFHQQGPARNEVLFVSLVVVELALMRLVRRGRVFLVRAKLGDRDSGFLIHLMQILNHPDTQKSSVSSFVEGG